MLVAREDGQIHGGAQRDRLDIAQGVYGPFKWAGFDEWVAAQQGQP